MNTIQTQDFEVFRIGFGAFLYGKPPVAGKTDLDVSVVISDGDDFRIREIKDWLDVSAKEFEEKHGIHVDGILMTESDWMERQRRIFGTHPHEPRFAAVETWEDTAYVPIHNERYITEKINFCHAHPIEGIQAINPEMRFGTGAVERR